VKNWNFLNTQEDFQTIREVVDTLLERRGFFEKDKILNFLYPRLKHLSDPCRIPDMEIAVNRVDRAFRNKESVLLFTDYDVDGMSSGALLFRFLSSMGLTARVVIPERFSEGYGLSLEALERILEDGKPDLIFCLDCGTTNSVEVKWLKEKGIDVLILDHHELASELPPADAFVNPQRNESDHDLATVGLVFKFIHAFLKMTGQQSAFDLKGHLDLVALGTVSDLVPLRGDNRILVHYGLRQLGETRNLGLRELMRVAGVKKKPGPATVGFLIGPRLNASGRLTSAEEGWKLLTTEDPLEARRLAKALDHLNRKRQKVEQEVFQDARDQVHSLSDEERSHCIVVASRQWHQGVIGIVASRLQRIWYRPTIVISVDEAGNAKGSGRSIRGCSLMDALRECEQHLAGFGGHAMAAGMELHETQVDELRRSLNRWFSENVDPQVFEQSLDVDVSLPGRLLSEELALELRRMEPFGQSNRCPVFAIQGVQVLGQPRYFGKNHVRFRGEVDGMQFDVVAFGLCTNGLPQQVLDLAGHWEMDDFTGAPCFRVLEWK